MNNRKIYIIDDEPVIRESIGRWLSKKYEVFSYASGEEYLEATKKFNPKDQALTCILLDFQMPGMNGVELQTKLKHLNSNFSIIFMSGNARQSDIIDAWHGGAIDFILKPFTPIKINELLEKQFSSMEERASTASKIENSRPDIKIPITRREAEVLLLLGSGNSQLEVGQQLGISLSTVKMYRAFLKDKLGLNTLTELIRYYDSNLKAIEKITTQ